MKELTIDNLISWLETKPPDETYVYVSSDDCLYARFLKEHGHPVVHVGGFDWRDAEGQTHSIPENLIYTVANSFEDGNGHTYGRALERAKRRLADPTWGMPNE